MVISDADRNILTVASFIYADILTSKVENWIQKWRYLPIVGTCASLHWVPTCLRVNCDFREENPAAPTFVLPIQQLLEKFQRPFLCIGSPNLQFTFTYISPPLMPFLAPTLACLNVNRVLWKKEMEPEREGNRNSCGWKSGKQKEWKRLLWKGKDTSSIMLQKY